MRISDAPNLTSVDYEKTYVKCNFTDNHDIYFSDYTVTNNNDDDDDIIEFVVESINLVKKNGGGVVCLNQ